MKFQRNLRIVQGRFDIAPYATVFFLLLMFIMLFSLMPIPGLPLQLPEVNAKTDNDALLGTDHPTVNVAVDASGQFYYENQVMDEFTLRANLRVAAEKSHEPLTLVVLADKSVAYENLVRLTMLARAAGINNALLATLPRPLDDLRFAP